MWPSKRKTKLDRIWVKEESKDKLFQLKALNPRRNLMDLVDDCISDKLKNSKGGKKDDVFPKW